jgi:2,3,4,5-tetrahydropyridine-2,6-dicarboxylate N-succinyltransferase
MLPSEIEQLYNEKPEHYSEKQFQLFGAFKSALNEGTIRAAVPDIASASGWRVNDWVKKGILAGFRMGRIVDYSVGGAPAGANQIPFFDKSTYPPQKISLDSGVRIVPGGSSIRDACYIGKGVICMPPMFVNAGAYVDEGTMIDSHALVGSCAQVGKNCHISAAAQIGGVLEPVGALPVIIEDNVLVGGQCGIYEGVIVKARAVLGTGTILNASTPVYDLVHGTIHAAREGLPLIIPESAVVVPGSRAVSQAQGKAWGLSLYTPVIVKYRDAKTDARIQIEDLLR